MKALLIAALMVIALLNVRCSRNRKANPSSEESSTTVNYLVSQADSVCGLCSGGGDTCFYSLLFIQIRSTFANIPMNSSCTLSFAIDAVLPGDAGTSASTSSYGYCSTVGPPGSSCNVTLGANGVSSENVYDTVSVSLNFDLGSYQMLEGGLAIVIETEDPNAINPNATLANCTLRYTPPRGTPYTITALANLDDAVPRVCYDTAVSLPTGIQCQ